MYQQSNSPTETFWKGLGKLAGLAVRGVSAYRQEQAVKQSQEQAVEDLTAPVEDFSGYDDNFSADFGGGDDFGDYGVPSIMPPVADPNPAPTGTCSPCEARKRALAAAAKVARKFKRGG